MEEGREGEMDGWKQLHDKRERERMRERERKKGRKKGRRE